MSEATSKFRSNILLAIFTSVITTTLTLSSSYFIEKTKNLATKQDIEEITSKIELTQQSINYAINHLSVEDQLLIDLYIAYMEFRLIDRIPLDNIGCSSPAFPELVDHIQKINSIGKQIFMITAKLDLYCSDSEIRKSIDEVYDSFAKYADCKKELDSFKEYESYLVNTAQTGSFLRYANPKYKAIKDEINSLYDQYMKNSDPHRREFLKDLLNFQKIVGSKISKDIRYSSQLKNIYDSPIQHHSQ